MATALGLSLLTIYQQTKGQGVRGEAESLASFGN